MPRRKLRKLTSITACRRTSQIAAQSFQGEVLQILMHNLMLHGVGLQLGPDCDGILNLMDDPTLLSPAEGSAEVS